MSSLTELHELRDQILRVKETDSVPLVLVGNKSDLEEDRAVSRARAFQVSQSWGRVPYYETSARRRANVDEVFKDLCRQIIRRDMDAAGGGGGGGGGGSGHRGSGGSSGSHGHGRSSERRTPPEKRERDRRDGDRRDGRRRRRRRETSGPSCAIL
jgi:Ras-related protein Rap-1B